MYTKTMKLQAVQLYIKYDFSGAAVRNELGYPDNRTLKKWYDEFQIDPNACFGKKERKLRKYSAQHREEAVKHYYEHGRCFARTVRMLGYPNRNVLRQWVGVLAKDRKQHQVAHKYISMDDKTKAVIALNFRQHAAKHVSKEQGISTVSLYKWRKQLLMKGAHQSLVQKENGTHTPNQKELIDECHALTAEVQKLKMERDILLGTIEIIKKDPGVDPKQLKNREKTILIDALTSNYPLVDLLHALNLSKSSYYYQQHSKHRDKYATIRTKLKEHFTSNYCCFGYRRLYDELQHEGITCSEKVIRRLMKEEGLVVHSKPRRKFSAYKGEITAPVANLLKRDFNADKPNTKWLTDITEFHIPAGKVYLSPIVDCFDGLLVSWTIGTSPDAALVNTMLSEAISTLKEEHPVLHSDRGCHYRWPGWIDRMNEAKLIRSMSKKGCTPDNAACEGVFGRIKNEMFYNRSWQGVSLQEFIAYLDKYLQWYNHRRSKRTLNKLSPIQYRRELGLIA